jgi:hypothetical protein
MLQDWTCPTGFQPVPLLDGTPVAFSACRPPDAPAQACPPGMFAVLGQPDCQPLGDPCPTGDFADGLPQTGVVYVKPGGTGDGSSAQSPMGSIGDAISAASAGQTVALAKGTYEELVPLTKGVMLAGACVEQTILQAPSTAMFPDAVVTVTSPDSGTLLKNVTVTGNALGIVVANGATFTGQSLHIDRVQAVAADLPGAHVTLNKLRISNVQPGTGMAAGLQLGMWALMGAQVTLTDAVFDAGGGIGMYICDMGTKVTAGPLIMFGQASVGITADLQSESVFGPALFQDNADTDFQVSGGAMLTLTDTTMARSGGASALAVSDGSMLMAQRLFMDRPMGTALAVGHTDTTTADPTATFEDVVVSNPGRYGLNASGATVKVTRALLQGPHGAAIGGFVSGGVVVGPDLELTDVAISKTFGRPSAIDHVGAAPGIYVESSKLTVLRAWIDQAVGLGAGTAQGSPTETPSMLSLTDLTITNTQPLPATSSYPGSGGSGLSLGSGTTTLTRAMLKGNRAVGLQVGGARFNACGQLVVGLLDGGTTTIGGETCDAGSAITVIPGSLIARDVVVDGTLSQQTGVGYGDALSVVDNATVDMARAVLSGSARYGVIVVGATVKLDTVNIQCDAIPVGQGTDGQFNLVAGTVACQCATSSDPQQQSCRPDMGDQVQPYELPPLPPPQP